MTSYHPDRYDQVIAIKGAEVIRHAEDRVRTEPEGPLSITPNTRVRRLSGEAVFLISSGHVSADFCMNH